jgi:hypothetical protein
MPFACDARGGQVRLTPADQRAYRIIGRREHHVFTVCSPTDPNRCRNWRIHRFDVDCGGERVSWLKVADAARRYTRAEAFVEAGTMHLRMGPIWSAGRQETFRERRLARRAERFGADAPYGYDPRNPEDEVIDLPPGFAPTFGLPVSFQGGPGPSDSFDAVEGPPPKPEPYGDEEIGADDDAYTSRTERRYAQGAADADYDRGSDDSRYGEREFDRAGLPIERPPQQVQSAPVDKPREPVRDSKTEAAASQTFGSTVAGSSSKSAPAEKSAAKSETPKVETPKVETPKPEAAKPEAPKPAAPKAEAAAAPPKPIPPTPPGVVTPTILNAPGAAEAARAAEAAAKAAEAQPAAVTPAPEKSTPPVPQAVEPPVAPAETPPAKTETAIPVVGLTPPTSSGLDSFAFAPWHWIALAGGAALLTILSWFLLIRRNEGYDAGLPPRDFAAVSLDGNPAAGKSLVPFSEPGLPSPVPDVRASAPLPVAPSAEIRMPATLSEALQVLGSSADARPDVLKKIVEGLRQSWHPDLARSEEDRSYRAQRVAQINVAWDIIEASLRPAA